MERRARPVRPYRRERVHGQRRRGTALRRAAQSEDIGRVAFAAPARAGRIERRESLADRMVLALPAEHA